MEKTGRGDHQAMSESDEEKWVHDSSVDHKGQVPTRASTGVWKAYLFIIPMEFSERLSYFGIATNLIMYLTGVLHQDLGPAAKNVNYWTGLSTLMPLVGGFLADTYTGRFTMVLLSSIIYLMGLGLLTMSEFIPSLKACDIGKCKEARKIHEVVFFIAMYSLSIGTGGIKPCLESFGADQFDDNHPVERIQKMSYFNWWSSAVCCGLLLGVTLIVSIQDNLSWGIADLVLAIFMAVTLVIFYMGKPYYRYRIPEGSPIKPMFQVLIAAVRKRRLSVPSNPTLLYEAPMSKMTQGRLLCHTSRLRFLDKAAIIEAEENMVSKKSQNPWRLQTVTRVEEMKLILNMIPIWLTSLTFGICVAQSSTFFVKQAATMNRKLDESITIPPASIYSIGAIAMIVSVIIYDKILVPYLRRATGEERGLKILQRIGIGMVFSVIAMAVAALVERKRLKIVEQEIIIQGGGESMGKTLSMSVFWLAPQYSILGLGEAFTLVGLQEYFYDQVPDSMKSLGIAFYLSVIGLGSFMSSFLIIIVDHITGEGKGGGDHRSWIGKDLNMSRLDNFFWLLTALNLLNLCVYVLLARKYTYKKVQPRLQVKASGVEELIA